MESVSSNNEVEKTSVLAGLHGKAIAHEFRPLVSLITDKKRSQGEREEKEFFCFIMIHRFELSIGEKDEQPGGQKCETV